MKRIAVQVYLFLRQLYKKARISLMSLAEVCHRPTYAGHPIPPPRMRQLTTAGHVTVTQHIQEGLRAAKMIEEAVQREIVEPESVTAVLDFGCGCGRVLRHLRGVWPHAQLFGSDVDEKLINWTRKNLHELAQWHTGDYLPPSEFGPESLDIIYAVSVFTHMDEEAQSSWLDEFHRIMKPKGIILLTVSPLRKGDSHNSWDYQDQRGMMYQYRRHEIVNRSWVKRQTVIPHYIDAKHSEIYCKSVWGILFEFRGFFRGSLGSQALVVLRKR